MPESCVTTKPTSLRFLEVVMRNPGNQHYMPPAGPPRPLSIAPPPYRLTWDSDICRTTRRQRPTGWGPSTIETTADLPKLIVLRDPSQSLL